MAERMVQQTLNGAGTTPRKWNGYSREEKLCVIKWYGENGKNLRIKVQDGDTELGAR